jgi:predicted acyl esterase
VRNQNTAEDVGSSTRMSVAHQTVLHDDDHPSHLALPVVPIRIP